MRQCPPLMTGHLKNSTDYIFDLETINVVQSLYLMSFWVQGSKSQYLEAFVVILRPYFILIFIKKKCLIRGDTKINKIPPMCQKFLLSLMDDIFVICYLKKSSQTTEIPMITCILKKKVAKPVLSRYFRLYPPCLLAEEKLGGAQGTPTPSDPHLSTHTLGKRLAAPR